MSYFSEWDSLDRHELPEWFRDAKLGIMVHWGAYSVPAWAPVGEYAEWYPDSWMNGGDDGERTATQRYHEEHFPGISEHRKFLERWRAGRWDPDEWATLFDDVGARYVVLTGEHHDGIPLWPTDATGWNAATRGPRRDVVGELGTAVRDRGLKFAPSFHALTNYYQPDDRDFELPDGLWHERDELDEPDPRYVAFMNEKLRELVDEYRPDLLWLDGDWSGTAESYRTAETLAYYYNRAEEWDKPVAANDRLGHVRGEKGDFYVRGYESVDDVQDHYWESCRGIGHSFGYNRTEGPDDHLSTTELVHLLCDVVSKNGNLLLNVGPKANGEIPEIQRVRLRGLGDWLETNGEAIFGTRPWVTATDSTADVPVRYTWADGRLYAILFDRPDGEIRLSVSEIVPIETVPSASVLAEEDRRLEVTRRDDELVVSFGPGDPAGLSDAYVVALDDVPRPAK